MYVTQGKGTLGEKKNFLELAPPVLELKKGGRRREARSTVLSDKTPSPTALSTIRHNRREGGRRKRGMEQKNYCYKREISFKNPFKALLQSSDADAASSSEGIPLKKGGDQKQESHGWGN